MTSCGRDSGSVPNISNDQSKQAAALYTEAVTSPHDLVNPASMVNGALSTAGIHTEIKNQNAVNPTMTGSHASQNDAVIESCNTTVHTETYSCNRLETTTAEDTCWAPRTLDSDTAITIVCPKTSETSEHTHVESTKTFSSCDSCGVTLIYNCSAFGTEPSDKCVSVKNNAMDTERQRIVEVCDYTGVPFNEQSTKVLNESDVLGFSVTDERSPTTLHSVLGSMDKHNTVHANGHTQNVLLKPKGVKGTNTAFSTGSHQKDHLRMGQRYVTEDYAAKESITQNAASQNLQVPQNVRSPQNKTTEIKPTSPGSASENRKLVLDPEAVHRFFSMNPSDEIRCSALVESGCASPRSSEEITSSTSNVTTATQRSPRTDTFSLKPSSAILADKDSAFSTRPVYKRHESSGNLLEVPQALRNYNMEPPPYHYDNMTNVSSSPSTYNSHLTEDLNASPLKAKKDLNNMLASDNNSRRSSLKLQIPIITHPDGTWDFSVPDSISTQEPVTAACQHNGIPRLDLSTITSPRQHSLMPQMDSMSPASPVIITLDRATPDLVNSNWKDLQKKDSALIHRRHSINVAHPLNMSPSSPRSSGCSTHSTGAKNCSPLCLRRNSVSTEHPANINLSKSNIVGKTSPRSPRRNSLSTINPANINYTAATSTENSRSFRKTFTAASPTTRNVHQLSPRTKSNGFLSPKKISSPLSPSVNIVNPLQALRRNSTSQSDNARNTTGPVSPRSNNHPLSPGMFTADNKLQSPGSPRENSTITAESRIRHSGLSGGNDMYISLQNTRDHKMINPENMRHGTNTTDDRNQSPGSPRVSLIRTPENMFPSPASPNSRTFTNIADTRMLIPGSPGLLSPGIPVDTRLQSPGNPNENTFRRVSESTDPTVKKAVNPVSTDACTGQYTSYGPSTTGTWDWTAPRRIRGMQTGEENTGAVSPTADLDQENDELHQKSIALQEQSLGPLKEDLAEWIARTLGIDISADTFMDVLDNGVYLCSLANLIHQKAIECVQQGTCQDVLPDIKLRCNKKAKTGSWFARDNTANYTTWCKAFGFRDDCTFESEDLVSHKNERQVIISLLELARLGYKYGLEPPSLIKMEKEIEAEEPVPFEEPPPPKPVIIEEKKKKPPPQSARTRPLNLDEEVRKMAAKCKCSEHVKRLREGTYMVFGKVVIVRLLKNRHLMVRVGGGWDTLEHYLIHHNPLYIVEHRRNSSFDFLDGDDVVQILLGMGYHVKKNDTPSELSGENIFDRTWRLSGTFILAFTVVASISVMDS